MTDELKPVRCGCGGEAEIFQIAPEGGVKSYCVRCEDCLTQTRFFTGDKDKAITAWNRAMRRAKVDILQNTSEDKGEMPYCPHCGDELEWE